MRAGRSLAKARLGLKTEPTCFISFFGTMQLIDKGIYRSSLLLTSGRTASFIFVSAASSPTSCCTNRLRWHKTNVKHNVQHQLLPRRACCYAGTLLLVIHMSCLRHATFCDLTRVLRHRGPRLSTPSRTLHLEPDWFQRWKILGMDRWPAMVTELLISQVISQFIHALFDVGDGLTYIHHIIEPWNSHCLLALLWHQKPWHSPSSSTTAQVTTSPPPSMMIRFSTLALVHIQNRSTQLPWSQSHLVPTLVVQKQPLQLSSPLPLPPLTI